MREKNQTFMRNWILGLDVLGTVFCLMFEEPVREEQFKLKKKTSNSIVKSQSEMTNYNFDNICGKYQIRRKYKQN